MSKDSNKIRTWAVLFALLAALVSSPAKAVDAVFPDVNLAAAIEEALGFTNPQVADVAAITVLDIRNKGIIDLTGMEIATSLQTLWLTDNQVADVSTLSGLTTLTMLWLENNNVLDISGLSTLTNLERLRLDGNQIADISSLAPLSSLQRLHMANNQISDISVLSVFTELFELLLDGNQISDVSAVAGLTDLTFLRLNNNQISDVSPVAGLTLLDQLWLHQNIIADISALAGLVNLTQTGLDDNQITDLSPLLGLTNFTLLRLETNPLSPVSLTTHVPVIIANNPGITLELGIILTVEVTAGQGTVIPNGGAYKQDSLVELAATPDPEFLFLGWFDETDTLLSTEDTLDVVMDVAKTISVEFAAIPTFLLTVEIAAGQGTVTPDGGVFEEDTLVALAATPDPGYDFLGWFDETDTLLSTEDTLEIVMDMARTISVEFEPIPTFLLTVEIAAGQGTVTPNGGPYEPNALVELVATPDPGYRFVGWFDETDTLLSSEDTLEVVMDMARTISVEFERIPAPLTITKAVIKASKTRDPAADSLVVSGTIDTEGLALIFDPLNDPTQISISLIYEADSMSYGHIETLDSTLAKVNAEKGKITYKASTKGSVTGRVTGFKVDLKKGAFTIKAKKIDLSGLSSPSIVIVEVGDYYGLGMAAEDVINGKKPIPMCLLLNVADALRVKKAKFDAANGSLMVQGDISVQNSLVDIADEDVTLRWGTYSITLDKNDLFRSGDKAKFKYKRPARETSSIAAALIDLVKCTFKVVIKDPNIGEQTAPVAFGMSFADFDEEVDVSDF